MHLTGEQMPFGGRGRQSNPWRMLVYAILIVIGIVFTRLVEVERVQLPFMATSTPTRVVTTYLQEAQAYFSAGDLQKCIESYQLALKLDPNNARIWAEMARVQTYSSGLTTNSAERQAQLAEARTSINQAISISEDDSFVHAVRALVYDWSASAVDSQDLHLSFLTEAETAAVFAKKLDPNNVLALAYYAEVLVDQQKWAQAMDVAAQAVTQVETRTDVNDSFKLDVYRVSGSVFENNGYYQRAIEEYWKAVEYAPALTFLYLRLGVNYRQLKFEDPQNLDRALEVFARAAQINEQNKILDPIPYLAIGKTYMQEGEFFAAALNISRALIFDSQDADIYGRLGLVYFKARNYESSLDVLNCAINGCDAELNRKVLCEAVYGCDPEDAAALQYGAELEGLLLDSNSVVYYYTYASALAFYGYCDEAEVIMQELDTVFGDDDLVAEINAENRAICAGTTIEPAGTPTPEAAD